MRSVTDGVVLLRSPTPGDVPTLVAGRDEVSRRFLGAGDDDPSPVACIEVQGRVVGWIDYDIDRTWLQPGEVNIGYNVFPHHRHRGYATRALQLLVHHLATSTDQRTATLLIDPANTASLALAARAGFPLAGELDGNPYFKRPVPPLAYSDGLVSIRRPASSDAAASLEAVDAEQLRWLWLAEWREEWSSKTAAERFEHQRGWLETTKASFGQGPKWSFTVADVDDRYVGHVDCDLANESVPTGEANISYSSHPAARGRGYISRAVRLITAFLIDHTGAREAHIIVDADNTASIRVARSVGAKPIERFVDSHGRPMLRHVLRLERRRARPSAGPG